MADVPHLAWPYRLAPDGRLAVVEQDTLADVTQAVHGLAVTPRGARPLAPDLGVDDPTFSPGVSPAQLEADLARAHPLAGVTVETAGPDESGRLAITVHVDLAE
jgi:hypothetical protein